MKPMLMIVIAVVVLTILVPPGVPAAQTPQVTPPADPNQDLPRLGLDGLWEEIDCDCECDCCARIKKLIKKRLKDPNARPMLAPGARGEKGAKGAKKGASAHHRRSHRVKKEMRHPHGTGSKYDRARPRTGNAWLDAAHTHKLRKARAARRKARAVLTDEQREKIQEMRHQERLQLIDLKASLQKRELELKRMIRKNETSEKALRAAIDAIANIKADIQFLKLKTRLDSRGLLTDEQRVKIRKRK